MSSTTTNYNLHKIDLADSPPDITVLNQNFDIIDEKLNEHDNLTASDVGALKIYTSFDQLGLTSATATPKLIAEKMATHSILIVGCGLEPFNNGWLPLRYALLTVIKGSSASVVSFKAQASTAMSGSPQNIIGNELFGYYNSSNTNNEWSGWHEYADASKFLPLDGSVPMSGDLVTKASYKIDKGFSNGGYLQIFKNYSESGDYGTHFVNKDGVNNKKVDLTLSPSPLSGYELALIINDGGMKRIFGEHNKPSGTYTGNGSSSNRTIATGGIGNLLIVQSGNGTAFVTQKGALVIDGTSYTSMSWLTNSSVYYNNGTLGIASTNIVLNTSGTTYTYFCI